MGILLAGELTFVIAGEPHHVSAGGMWRIPGGVEHSAIAGPDPVQAIDVFHPVRKDYQ
jgi:quercetin dioxygenase-like cupin family protein